MPAPVTLVRRRICRAIALVALLGASHAHGHHSIAAVYDSAERRTLEAVVVEFRFENPHPKILVEETGNDGRPVTWTLEMDNRWELAELGFDARTLRPGDRIVVSGSLSRRQPNALYVRRLERPADGFSCEHHR
ncbi:MAG: hypothetical protein JXB36_06035 [Gammaproteobacteria bacterium]|nr:hypothetical protein [Gammaproteobacteria bacterium]